MKRLYAVPAILFVLALGNQVLAQDVKHFGPQVGCCGNLNGRTVILIVDSVSGLTEIDTRLQTLLGNSGFQMPLIRTIQWANNGEPLENRNRLVQLGAAARLLMEIKQVRMSSPTSPIVLMGYSDGAFVVLLAAQQLPPGYVDRIILFAPAVNSCYDVRGAIRASKLGMDVFFSSDDTVLESYETGFGTVDGYKMTTAGTTGFLLARSPIGRDPIFCNLRQLDSVLVAAVGGHFATVSTSFLRKYVVPLIPFGPVAAIIPPQGVPVPPYAPPTPVPPYGPPSPPPSSPVPSGPPVPPPYGAAAPSSSQTLPSIPPPPAPAASGSVPPPPAVGPGNMPPPPLSTLSPLLPPPAK